MPDAVDLGNGQDARHLFARLTLSGPNVRTSWAARAAAAPSEIRSAADPAAIR